VETLARVRRLAKNSPLFQLNIANESGRQLIVSEGVGQPQIHPLPIQQNLFSS
jgi:hypothetical protein